MVFSEQVRLLPNEEELLNVATTYESSGAGGWETLHDYGNIVLGADTLIIFSYTIKAYEHGGSGGEANHRLKLGSLYVSGYPVAGGNESWNSESVIGIVWLPAGTYGVLMEGAPDYLNVSNYCKIAVANMKVGKVEFSDVEHSDLAMYSSQISKTLTTRKLALGTISNGLLHVQVFAKTVGAQTNFENVGDALTNGVSISIDSVQVDWTWRKQDDQVGSWDVIFGAASAKYYSEMTAGAVHTIDISKDNANTDVYVSVVFTPWLLGLEHEPLSLDFSQGSTLYLMLEPLMSNPTKNIKLGKKRAVSFGDSTDYYSTGSGTNILSWNYTFEIVEVDDCVLVVKGYGGCIAVVGVDMR